MEKRGRRKQRIYLNNSWKCSKPGERTEYISPWSLENTWLPQHKKALSKTHYTRVVKSEWQRILKIAREKGQWPTKEPSLGYWWISQQKPYRPRRNRMTFSKYWKIETGTQEYSIHQSYHSDIKEKKTLPDKNWWNSSTLNVPCKVYWKGLFNQKQSGQNCAKLWARW